MLLAKSGDTFERSVAVYNPDGSPANLSGVSVLMHIRDSAGVLVLVASTANGMVTISGNKINITIPAASMALPTGWYFYDVEVTYPSGRVKTHETDVLMVTEDYTHV
jgi:hypothetical protein